MRRDHWQRRIEALDPEVDFLEIYRILGGHEFPWDMTQSLGLALYRTYAVPSIGELLATTGEFTTRTHKRYADTGLILDAVVEHGFGHATGRAAIRRMNQMHGSYAISNDDMRYVLSTFVVTPKRWLDDYGWRALSPAEVTASVRYYVELGTLMGIKQIPTTYAGFERLLDDYEAEHFAFDEGGRRVADSTMALMLTFYPSFMARPMDVFSRALMDDPLLEAFRFPAPPRAVVRAARAGLRVRGRVEALMPARRNPLHAKDMPRIRSYPDGYDVDALGTFPRGCPVHQG